ncbi:DAK2 domain-containing protein [Cellulomonas sp. PhB143]|uniref:DAK2 domain-containing protein n=1 Tax=Cellulomonas sp. PhB143 TaxID=2485186 RepID=UPI000F482EA2|nr:DAK2 domain-containing protein [Cellulomonas sp. PhB143]ROS73564.1 hypothetical protein EDF32_2416 [Cellulomonas sp. PhB143]
MDADLSLDAGAGPRAAGVAVAGPAEDALRAWVASARADLLAVRERVDALNVFPVADSDTGTNLYLTFARGAQEVDGVVRGAGAGDVAAALVRGTLLGARGNSGAILAEYLRGLARAVAEDEPATVDGAAAPDGAGGLDVGRLVDAFAAAARGARGAVQDPVAGTVLSAADAAARGAREVLAAGAHVPRAVDVTAGALRAAQEETARSTGKLDVLRRSGVLDAGALGLCVVLAALHRVLGGEVSEADGMLGSVGGVRVGTGNGTATGTADAQACVVVPHAAAPEEAAGGEFEVMFVLRAPAPVDDDVARGLRADLAALGDSVVVTGGAGTWQAHVHTDEPARAVAAGRRRARTVRGAVRQAGVRSVLGGDAHAAGQSRTGIVVVTSAPGLAPEYARAGAVVLVLEPGAVAEPDDVARAVVDARAGQVLVLPGRALGAQGFGARLAALVDGEPLVRGRVDVLDAPTDLHAVAALAALQTSGDGPEGPDATAVMRVAAAAVRAGAADLRGVPPHRLAGRLRALVADVVGPSTEVVTVLRGRRVPGRADTLVEDAVGETAPGAEVVVIASGRDDAGVEVGAE